MTTLREQFVKALESAGERQVPSRSSKFLTFTRTRTDYFWFIGKSGALRYGKTSTKSFAAPDWMKRQVLGTATRQVAMKNSDEQS